MIDELLRNAEGHRADPELPAPPALGVAILTCMDARIDPAALLGLRPGDAHVIRNAGGVVTDDALRSLILSQALLGTREVMVVQHTGCGLIGDEDELRASVAAATGTEPPGPLHAFTDVEESVRASVQKLRHSPHLGDAARGFVYEVETGRLREVTP
jgi:carbonic anhydrase